MWNRLQTAANNTTATSVANKSKPKPRHSSSLNVNVNVNVHADSPSDDLAADRQFWQKHFDNRLSILGPGNSGNATAGGSGALPYRFSIQRGKAVPSPNGSRDDLPILPSEQLNPPPRNPRRQFKKELYHRPASSVYGDNDDNDDDNGNSNSWDGNDHHKDSAGDIDRRHYRRGYDTARAHPDRRIGSDDRLAPPPRAHTLPASTTATDLDTMYSYTQNYWAGEQVSPPSSPDLDVRDGFMDHEVSPIDDEPDSSQREFMAGRTHGSTQQNYHQHVHARAPQPAPQPSVQHAQASSTSAKSRQPRAATSPPQVRNNKNTNIPMMRRERRKFQDSQAAGARDAKANEHARAQATSPGPGQIPLNYGLSWDDGSDEAGGAHGQSISGSPDLGEPQLGSTTTITSAHQRRTNTPSPSLGQRMRQFGKNGKAESLETRPAWNGASGRAAIVKPLHDDPDAAPLKAPARTNNPSQVSKASARRTSGAPISPASPGDNSYTSAASAAMRKFMTAKASLKQSTKEDVSTPPPPKAATQTVAAPLPSPPHASPPPSQSPVPTATTPAVPTLIIPPTSSSEKAIKRKPPPSSSAQPKATGHTPQPSTSSSIYSSQPDRPISTVAQAELVSSPAAVTSLDTWGQPQSRFSITTYATSNPGTPRPSDEQTQPPLPTDAQTKSVMERSRPLRGGNSPHPRSEDPIVVSLKTTIPSPTAADGPNRDLKDLTKRIANLKQSDRPPSIMSMDKALPLAPPEMVETGDRITLLSARLSGLANRRNNLNKSIKQMTELMPTDSLMASADVLRKREEEKQKVERLREELANVQQEEYELGLKLHRAYKRQDRDGDYESGTLWVRRVTS